MENLENSEHLNLDNVFDEGEVNKRDKIFNNTYDEVDLDTSEISFNVDPSFQEKTYEYTIDEKLVLEKVESLFKKETRFDKFKLPDEEGNFKKLNKGDINEVYLFVTSSLPKEPRIEIFSVLSSMFDINSEKFYDSLSNSFKSDLIIELKQRGFINNIKTLF